MSPGVRGLPIMPLFQGHAAGLIVGDAALGVPSIRGLLRSPRRMYLRMTIALFAMIMRRTLWHSLEDSRSAPSAR